MKKALFSLLLLLCALAATAQENENKITGRLIDKESKEPVEFVNIQLMKMDSTYVGGAVTDSTGMFQLNVKEPGRYLMRITSVGYVTQLKRLEMVKGNDLNLGTLTISTDAVMLKEATVTAQALKVTVVEDTFVYNSAAYRTPEGSVVEELVRRLPGAQIDDDGKITINGKEVKKIKVDGREFMTGDTQTALKNLPTSIIDKIKVYDEKSDLSRVTGIDDGNEETTLDFGIKKGMNKGTMTNVDLAIGTKNRYAERLMGAYMKDKVRVMAFGNANNVGNVGFGGGRGGNFGRGRNGLTTNKMAGVNFNYEDKGLLKMSGSVRWNHDNSDARSKTSAENFVSTTGAFSNSLNQSYSRQNSWNAQMRLEWTPDTMTNIMFRPTWSYSTNDGLNRSASAAFNVDPYLYVVDPLAAESLARLDEDSLTVNSRNNASVSYSNSKRFGGMLQLNRKLNSMGRNVTFRADANITKGDSKSLSTSNVTLYQVASKLNPEQDSVYYTNRFNLTPTRNHSYSLQTTYSEPLWKATFLQFSYKFTYSYSKSDRSTYDYSDMGYDFAQGTTPLYRSWDAYLTQLANPYQDRDENLSRFSEYQNYTHDIEVMFRMIRDNYNFNAGVLVQPQKSHFRQDYQGHKADTVRTVTNITPTLQFRYRFSKVSQLRINYRGSTSQPSMTQLLDITDDSDPLNISKGNPGLKPSFTNNLNIFYNNFIQSHQRFVMANVRFSTTRNSISNMVTYNDSTGGRTARPENINGNWNLASTFVFNTSVDTTGIWNINTSTDYSFANSVAYVSVDRNSSSQKNFTKTHTISERLATSLRPQWGDWSTEFELDGSVTYTHSRNHLQSQSNLDTWRFAYGGSINVTAPWGTSLSTDMHMNSRRGFNDKSTNTNELIWNAQIGQGFLKGKPLTVTLQFYDILHRQSNFSRTINAIQRSDTEYNSINSYAMLHVIYRLNLFGGKNARQQMRGGGPGEGPGNFGGGNRGGNRPGGGFGGGRPGGFGGFM